VKRVRRVHAGQRGTCTVFVALLGKPADAWGSVEAEPLGTDTYRLTCACADPGGDVAEFVAGELVRCERRSLGEGAPVLVAVEKAERPGIWQPFLVCHDHGQGGTWAFVVAESGSQIRSRYPGLFIAERMPAWVIPGVIDRLPTYDLRARPAGLLADLDRDRGQRP
jgi:hypothetical protein